MITPQHKAQLDYAAETNAAVRVLLAELETTKAQLHAGQGAAIVDLERQLAAAQLEIERLTTLALTWRDEVLSREEIVRIALDERDEAIAAFTQAGAV